MVTVTIHSQCIGHHFGGDWSKKGTILMSFHHSLWTELCGANAIECSDGTDDNDYDCSTRHATVDYTDHVCLKTKLAIVNLQLLTKTCSILEQ